MDTTQIVKPEAQPLRDALTAIRERDHISLTEQARLIGVSHSMLSLFTSGKRGPGEKLLRGVMTNLRELTPVINEYLGNGHDED